MKLWLRTGALSPARRCVHDELPSHSLFPLRCDGINTNGSMTTHRCYSTSASLFSSVANPLSSIDDSSKRKTGKGFANPFPSSFSSSPSVYSSTDQAASSDASPPCRNTSTNSTSSSNSSAFPSFKNHFEDSLQRLFQVPTLRVDLSPVKRPLMEGSVWFDSGKMKVSLISGICGNSREDVETRLRERAELLASEFNKGFKDPTTKTEREAQAVTKRIQSAVGTILPQLINHLDIQLHIKFSFDKDEVVLDRHARRVLSKEEEAVEKKNILLTCSLEGENNPGSSPFPQQLRRCIRCSIYMREVWETKMQWTTMASVTQDDVGKRSPQSSFGALVGLESNTLLQALQKAANTVEEVLLRKREDHYFECIREAELLLKEVSHSPFFFDSFTSPTSGASLSYSSLAVPGEASMPSILRSLQPVELRSSILQSSRGAPLMLKVALTDEAGNLSACALPLSGGCFTVVRNKLHLSIHFQYSCIQENSDVEEIPLEQLVDGVGSVRNTAQGQPFTTMAPSSSSPSSLNVQSSMLPPPQRAVRLLSTLLPTLWYHLSTLSKQDDLHEHALLSSCPERELKSSFMAAMVVHAGTVLHDEWWSAYCVARKTTYAPIPYLSLSTSNKKTLERYEEKLSTILGWREAPVLHVVRNASLICFAVSDSKKRVLALGLLFENMEHFSSAIGEEELAFSRPQGGEYGRKQKMSAVLPGSAAAEVDGDDSSEDGLHDFSSSSFFGMPASCPPCNIEIVAVEETLLALGATSGVFDASTSTLELTMEKKGNDNEDKSVSRTLIFSQLNEAAGIARLFRYCQKTSPKKTVFHPVRLDSAGSTYCRRVQRLLALAFRKGQLHKPGLRGKWLPIPVPCTSKFLVLSFTSTLQREMFSLNLLTTLEPFCRIPPDYPSFQWPACRLPAPCFFNFWGPTKKLLQRLGAYYYCSIETTSSAERPTPKSANQYNTTSKGTSSSIERSNGESDGGSDRYSKMNTQVNQKLEEEIVDKSVSGKEDLPLFYLCVFSGNSSSLNEEAYRLPLHGCLHASELPITVLMELDRLVCEQTRSAHAKKTQFERLQKILCDRAVPREITLSSPFYWPKVLRLLYDSQEYYVRHQNQYKLLLEITPSLKTAELAVIDVSSGREEEWKNVLATKYAEQRLLPLLEPVSALYTRGFNILEKLPSPPPANNAAGKQLKFFSINIRADLKQNNFHGSLSAGSSSFRKDTIQGLPSATPTAALESLLDEIDETDEQELLGLGQQVYNEITSGVPETETNPFTTLANNSKLICSLELSAAQETLSPYLSDLQTLIRLKKDLKAITHEYHWACETLKIMATTNIPGDSPVELASKSCKWDEIPIVLPQLYTKFSRKEGGKYRKTEAELERAMTKGAVAMLEYEVRTRIVPVMGTEKLFQNIRVVQVLGESMWYAELRLPAGLLKIHSIGEPRLQETSLEGVFDGREKNLASPALLKHGKASASGLGTSPLSAANNNSSSIMNDGNREKNTVNQKLNRNREVFYVCCSTNTKRGALRKILSEFYRLYVACVDSKITLFGGQAPSPTALGTAVVDKKPAPAKTEKKSIPVRGTVRGGGNTSESGKVPANSSVRPRMIPPFMLHPNSLASGPSIPGQNEEVHKGTYSLATGKEGGTGSPSCVPQVPLRGEKEALTNTSFRSSVQGLGAGEKNAEETFPGSTSQARKVARPGQSSNSVKNASPAPPFVSSTTPDSASTSTSYSKTSSVSSPSSSVSAKTPRKVVRQRATGASSSTASPHACHSLLSPHASTPGGNSTSVTEPTGTVAGGTAANVGIPSSEHSSRTPPHTLNSSSPKNGNLKVPRKVRRPQAAASSVSFPPGSSSNKNHQNLSEQPQALASSLSPSSLIHSSMVGAIMDELQTALSSSNSSSCTCVLRLSHSLGARLFRRATKEVPPSSTSNGITAPIVSECLISQSLWSPTAMWQPFQLLQFFIMCLCHESVAWSSGKDSATRCALLQGLCRSIRPPNTVLEPSMPAKQFCVFFFHRYFGWPACDMEDVSHMLAASQAGAVRSHQQNILILAEAEQQDAKTPSWIGTIKLVQCHPGTAEFVYCEVLSSSSMVQDAETAVTEAWENCMVKIVTSFGFDQETNIYQYNSLDDAVINAIRSF